LLRGALAAAAAVRPDPAAIAGKPGEVIAEMLRAERIAAIRKALAGPVRLS
jgi:hypothetical protein